MDTQINTEQCSPEMVTPKNLDNIHPDPVNGRDYMFSGPSYYIPTERSWVSVQDYRRMPLETRRDAILFQSVQEWRNYIESRESLSTGFVDIPAKYPTVHSYVLSPCQQRAWNRRWTGPGFFVPSANAWMHEQIGPNIPTEAIQFYNEEDWIKFKHINENPELPDVKPGTIKI